MTIAERMAIAEATESCLRLSAELKGLQCILASLSEMQDALAARVAALEAKPSTLTLKGR